MSTKTKTAAAAAEFSPENLTTHTGCDARFNADIAAAMAKGAEGAKLLENARSMVVRAAVTYYANVSRFAPVTGADRKVINKRLRETGIKGSAKLGTLALDIAALASVGVWTDAMASLLGLPGSTHCDGVKALIPERDQKDGTVLIHKGSMPEGGKVADSDLPTVHALLASIDGAKVDTGTDTDTDPRAKVAAKVAESTAGALAKVAPATLGEASTVELQRIALASVAALVARDDCDDDTLSRIGTMIAAKVAGRAAKVAAKG